MKLKEGDIFSIFIPDKGFARGQIVKIPNKESLSIVIYEELFDRLDDKELDEILKDCTPLFFGNTFDAKFYHKHWTVMGNNRSNLSSINLPYYKIGSFPVYVEDFNENKLRRASKEEKDFLLFRKYVAPVRFEKALLAYHELSEWNDELFNPLLYSYNLKSKELIERKGIS